MVDAESCPEAKPCFDLSSAWAEFRINRLGIRSTGSGRMTDASAGVWPIAASFGRLAARIGTATAARPPRPGGRRRARAAAGSAGSERECAIKPTNHGCAEADLLLVNASNYPALPIYPYAFIQVSAIAARHGLTVRRLDLLGHDRAGWPALIGAALEQSRPRAVGLHLRQADSLFIWDYAERAVPGAPTGTPGRYFPVDATVHAAEVIRTLTDVPLLIGGFGFSTHARAVLSRLNPDFGVVGEPDQLFERFDQVLGRTGLAEVANLAYREGDGYRVNPRVHFGPADHPEYTEALLADLVEFYGRDVLDDPDGPYVPVEIMRGCPYRCYFCTEPMVKGRQHRIRDLDAVMADIRFLADRGVGRVWLVCSEINIGGNELLFDLARRMRELNRGRDRKVAWSSYLLPNPELPPDRIRWLLESDFIPGWNQFMSYEDENLKASLVPYRSRHAVASQLDWAREEGLFNQERGIPARPRRLDMFLGNSFADGETIAATLARADEAGLPEYFDRALITRATRVFDLGDGPIGGSGGNAFTISPAGPLPQVDLLYPTFSYPRKIVAVLGGTEATDEFFAYVEDTFLSTAGRSRRDWREFLAGATDQATVEGWCGELARAAADPAGDGGLAAQAALVLRLLGGPAGGASALRRIFEPAGPRSAALRLLAGALVQVLVRLRAAEVAEVFERLGLPGYWDEGVRISAYRVGRTLTARYRSAGELLRDVAGAAGRTPDSVPVLAVKACLFANDVRFTPEYVELLFAH
jgi:hypothetical protein